MFPFECTVKLVSISESGAGQARVIFQVPAALADPEQVGEIHAPEGVIHVGLVLQLADAATLDSFRPAGPQTRMPAVTERFYRLTLTETAAPPPPPPDPQPEPEPEADPAPEGQQVGVDE